MRLRAILPAALVLVAGFGCKPPPLAQVETAFRREVQRTFNALNTEAQSRKEGLERSQKLQGRNPAMDPPTGMLFSTYTFDDTAFVVENFKCRTCGTTLLISVPSAEFLCRSCGHCPYKDHGPAGPGKTSPCDLCVGKAMPKEPDASFCNEAFFEKFRDQGTRVKKMFELTQSDTKKPLEATVRYIRRQWSHDPRGVVSVSPEAIAKAGSSAEYIPRAEGAEYARPGYHRMDATYVAEVVYRFRGGELVALTATAEQAVRPWKDLKGNRQ